MVLLRLLAAALLAAAAPAAACGTADTVCELAPGSYRLVLPETVPPGGAPALFHLHGWGASARGVTRNAAWAEILSARGYALIAPQGIPRSGRTQRDWAVRDARPHPRDDLAFFAAILDDASARGVDRDRVLLSGFSRGGSFVWDVACAAPALFRAYAPVAGAFWEPLPETCAGPVALLHTHGWTDRVVPLEGRSFRGGAVVQGDVFASLKRMRETLGCDARQPAVAPIDGPAWRRDWSDCRAGRLTLWLHPGGHAAPRGWLAAALDWFEARLAD